MLRVVKDFAYIYSLSITGGIPFLLISSTLVQWLTEIGWSKSDIGSLVSTLGVPYVLKIFIAPLVDIISSPISRIGHWRGWLVFSQILIICGIIFMSQGYWIFGGLTVALFSSIQDIIHGGYRINIISKSNQGNGSAFVVAGYRTGLLIGGSLSLWLSNYFAWKYVYLSTTFFMLIGPILTLSRKEPDIKRADSFIEIFKNIKNIVGIMKKIGMTVLVMRISDAVFNVLTWRFLSEIGYSKKSVAMASGFGFAGMLIGGFAAGFISKYKNIRFGVLNIFLIQSINFALMILLSGSSISISLMSFVIIFENFTAGYTAVSMYTLFAEHAKGSAMIFAMLSAIASFFRLFLVNILTKFSDIVDWLTCFSFLAAISFIWFLKILCCKKSNC
jgi:MFS transporter, PAT family, beta-lactamase induction signal transducer AmpG